MINSIALFHYNHHFNYSLIFVSLILLQQVDSLTVVYPHLQYLVTLGCDSTPLGVVTDVSVQ
jgi:hypothetical protein